MFALLRQLSKLLLLVFNLPQVLQLLTQLFSVQEKDGKLELGVVNVIAETLTQQDVQRLTQEIEEGKRTRRNELRQETNELIDQYKEIEDDESREYFIRQARARQLRETRQINDIDASDILSDDFIEQSIEAKKRQLEPSIVPSLTPITSFLGIPTMALKLQEYIPGFSAPNVTDQETSNELAEGFTADFPAGGDIFDGPVGEGNLFVEFKGATNNQDLYLYSSPNERDRLTFYVSQPTGPVRAFIIDYGNVAPELLSQLIIIDVTSHSNPLVDIRLEFMVNPDDYFFTKDTVLERLEDQGANQETEITLRIEDGVGHFVDIDIPLYLSTEPQE